MSRLTKKINDNSQYVLNHKEDFTENSYQAIQKLGKLEDIMEKYEIESIEELEELIKDYDDMAKSIVEMGLGIKVEIKNRSE